MTETQCTHPPERRYAWIARDDTASSGKVLVVACCDCGAVLQGAAELQNDDDELQPELDDDDLAVIARGWRWNVKDVLSRFIASAMADAGVPRAQRLAVIERLAVLGGEIDELQR